MVGPCGRILPHWLRAPCNGSGPATSTQYADGRTLGLISTQVVKGARQQEWPRHLSTHTRAEELTHNFRSKGPIRYTSRLCIPHTSMQALTHSHTHSHTHTQRTLPTTASVLETHFDIRVSSLYQTHTYMQAPYTYFCIPAKNTQ